MEKFKVIVAGAPQFRDYARLARALDTLLRDKLPHVTILTRAGAGRGADALTASYATARHLEHVAYTADFVKHVEPRAAERERLAALVRDANAALIVYDSSDW